MPQNTLTEHIPGFECSVTTGYSITVPPSALTGQTNVSANVTETKMIGSHAREDKV
jgi:hypothetical protein